jgi:hypothetical protein
MTRTAITYLKSINQSSLAVDLNQLLGHWQVTHSVLLKEFFQIVSCHLAQDRMNGERAEFQTATPD